MVKFTRKPSGRGVFFLFVRLLITDSIPLIAIHLHKWSIFPCMSLVVAIFNDLFYFILFVQAVFKEFRVFTYPFNVHEWIPITPLSFLVLICVVFSLDSLPRDLLIVLIFSRNDTIVLLIDFTYCFYVFQIHQFFIWFLWFPLLALVLNYPFSTFLEWKLR